MPRVQPVWVSIRGTNQANASTGIEWLPSGRRFGHWAFRVQSTSSNMIQYWGIVFRRVHDYDDEGQRLGFTTVPGSVTVKLRYGIQPEDIQYHFTEFGRPLDTQWSLSQIGDLACLAAEEFGEYNMVYHNCQHFVQGVMDFVASNPPGTPYRT